MKKIFILILIPLFPMAQDSSICKERGHAIGYKEVPYNAKSSTKPPYVLDIPDTSFLITPQPIEYFAWCRRCGIKYAYQKKDKIKILWIRKKD